MVAKVRKGQGEITMQAYSTRMGPAQVVIVGGASSWGAHETGHVTLPLDGDPWTLPIAYDEREAPFVVREDGSERKDLLVSLTDEGQLCGCALAEVDGGSELVGVGIDLASPADFGVRPGSERFIEVVFSARERELALELDPMRPHYAYATLFGAKEAAFKATARPLRVWCQTHDEALEFEVRDFGMERLDEERGELRHGAAQRALDCMGIERIRVLRSEYAGLALVVALAYGKLSGQA